MNYLHRIVPYGHKDPDYVPPEGPSTVVGVGNDKLPPRTVVLSPPHMIGITKEQRAKLAVEYDLIVEYHKLTPADVKPVKFPIEKRCTAQQISNYFRQLEPPTIEEALSVGFELKIF